MSPRPAESFSQRLHRAVVALGRGLVGTAACLLLLPLAATGSPSGAPVIAGASNLQFALPEIAQAFQDETGDSVRLAMGASGTFAEQIRDGAPFELFLSADEAFVFDLAREGLTRDQGTLYASGRIALMVPHGSPLAADGSLETLRQALADGRITRFAIADPDRSPYGHAARQALTAQGLWQPLQPFLVWGENASQAALFATSANAQGGIVAYSLALAPAQAEYGMFEPIPEEWHSPLRQRMVLLPEAGPVAERFYRYLQGPDARAILERHGFAPPGGGP